ncbi:TPA: Sir2 silent information regulator family NAD-dependent deacetylase [Streptococcus suis]|nr:Sir2 silent information regulator family NAD-dependent deacetylase [Streptococcus suis]HEL2725903.1 Sir2 silent information regulator family NAD-dependent deacetylase [Streptococcus suis]
MKQEKIDKAKKLLAEADAIVIGAGAGLSSAAGLTYSGQRFEEHFAPFIKAYGLTDMYSAGFYPFTTEEKKWSYWSQHLYLNRYQTDSLPLYQGLYEVVGDKNYFVITTNVDSQFEKAGFDQEKIFEVQGNYGEFQCSVPCHEGVYNNQTALEILLANRQGLEVRTDDIPKCPKCGADMMSRLRVDNRFVEDANWHKQEEAYIAFLQENASKKIVFLELGVGFNTPTIIKFPFERLNQTLPNASLIRLNLEDPEREGIITINQDMQEVISAWKDLKN